LPFQKAETLVEFPFCNLQSVTPLRACEVEN